MTASHQYSAALQSALVDFDDTAAAANWDVQPSDRVGPPLARRRGKLIVRGGIVMLSLAGAGWAYLDGDSMRATWARASTSAMELASSVLERRNSGQASAPVEPRTQSTLPHVEPASTPAAAEPPPQPLPAASPPVMEAAAPPAAPAASSATPTGVVIETPKLSRDPAAGPAAKEEVSREPATPVTTPYTETPAQPAKTASLEPYQKRAVAAGLHPELSRMLLEKLSQTDYKNAGVAIEKAMAAKEDAVFIWPKQAKPGTAIYKIDFVTGAAPGCRRYVVTISKEGWLTTALPVEKCGHKRTASTARE